MKIFTISTLVSIFVCIFCQVNNDRNGAKLTLAISRMFSYGLIIMAMFSRTPQIFKIWKTSSVDSISYQGLLIEVFNQFIMLNYNLYVGTAFTLYGESILTFLQNCIILFLFFQFDKGNKFCKLALLIIFCLPFGFQVLPAYVMHFSINLAVVAFVCARLSQMYEIYREHGVGSVSPYPFCINMVRNFTRLITLWVESSNDKLMFVQSVYFSMNLFMVSVYYAHSTIKPQLLKKLL